MIKITLFSLLLALAIIGSGCGYKDELVLPENAAAQQ